jgi:hypothetical protein
LGNNAAKASRAVEAFSLRFFNHSAVVSKGERAAFNFLPRGFLAFRECRNCSCRGESFLINLAFINLPSNCLFQMNESSNGVLHKPKKIIIQRALMRPGINSTQKLLTLDFPTSPSLRNFAGFTPGASQARPERILVATGNKGIEACKAKRRRKKVSMCCSNSRVYGQGAGKSQETSEREF